MEHDKEWNKKRKFFFLKSIKRVTSIIDSVRRDGAKDWEEEKMEKKGKKTERTSSDENENHRLKT